MHEYMPHAQTFNSVRTNSAVMAVNDTGIILHFL